MFKKTEREGLRARNKRKERKKENQEKKKQKKRKGKTRNKSEEIKTKEHRIVIETKEQDRMSLTHAPETRRGAPSRPEREEVIDALLFLL